MGGGSGQLIVRQVAPPPPVHRAWPLLTPCSAAAHGTWTSLPGPHPLPSPPRLPRSTSTCPSATPRMARSTRRRGWGRCWRATAWSPRPTTSSGGSWGRVAHGGGRGRAGRCWRAGQSPGQHDLTAPQVGAAGAGWSEGGGGPRRGVAGRQTTGQHAQRVPQGGAGAGGVSECAAGVACCCSCTPEPQLAGGGPGSRVPGGVWWVLGAAGGGRAQAQPLSCAAGEPAGRRALHHHHPQHPHPIPPPPLRSPRLPTAPPPPSLPPPPHLPTPPTLPHPPRFRVDKEAEVLCSKELGSEELAKLRDAVRGLLLLFGWGRSRGWFGAVRGL